MFVLLFVAVELFLRRLVMFVLLFVAVELFLRRLVMFLLLFVSEGLMVRRQVMLVLLFVFLYNHEMTKLGISETWLTPDTTDASLSILSYSLLRADSPSDVRKHGVAFYIHNSLVFQRGGIRYAKHNYDLFECL